MNYNNFIREKAIFRNQSGFEIELSEINRILKPHQKDIVKWAVIGGCRAIFASFGLGKTFMQLEILRIIQKYKGGRMLVIAPLGVRGEFFNDAEKLDRKGRGSELNHQYFLDGVRYLEAMEREKNIPTLFDFEKESLGKAV